MKVLFISHDASRTGAPLILLRLAQWIKKNDAQVQFDFLLLRGGELEAEFAAAGKVYRYFETRKTNNSLPARISRRLTKPDYRKEVRDQLAKQAYNLIYANTIASCSVAVEISGMKAEKIPLILHVHELDTIIRQLEPAFNQLSSKVDVFIAVSLAVKKNLLENRKIPGSKLRHVSEFMLAEEIQNAAGNNSAREFSSRLPGKFIVGGSGNVHWRKGADLFLQTARSVYQKEPGFNGVFLWIGNVSEHERIVLDEDIRKLGLEEKIFFPGPQNPPYEWYGLFDVFLMTSREDPFPIVSLEAGAMGKPVICFEKAGGTEEMLNGAGGKVVGYMDTAAMADAVLHYYRSPEEKERDGKKNAAHFAQYDINRVAPELMKVIHEQAG